MSKRKRASLGKTSADKSVDAQETPSTEDAAAKEDMAHVSPDMLSGSPDIFAPKWTDPPAAEKSPEVVTEPIVAEKPAEKVEAPAASTVEPEPVESSPVLAPEAAIPP